MVFKRDLSSSLLASCHRRCCVCHRFCGVKMELHHIEQRAEGGEDKLENAIPLCFECHAEVKYYNNNHPRGRKFTNEELLAHKNQWLDICKNHPESLISAPRDIDVGPLEGMLLELEHNYDVISQIMNGTSWQDKIGCILMDNEYRRSISQGSLLMLPDELRKIVSTAYSEVGRINTYVTLYSNTRPEGNAFAEATSRLLEAYRKSSSNLSSALLELKKFLLHEGKEDLR